MIEQTDEELEKCFISVSDTQTDIDYSKGKFDKSISESENTNHFESIESSQELKNKSFKKLIQEQNKKQKVEKTDKTNSHYMHQKDSDTKKDKIPPQKNLKNIPNSRSNSKGQIKSNIMSDGLINHFKNENNELRNTLLREIEILNKKVHDNQKVIFQYRQEKILLDEENCILKLEKEKIGTIKDTLIASLNEKIMKLEIETNKLTEMNEYSKKRIEEYLPKVFKYDELYEKYTKQCLEHEKLLENNSTLNNILMVIKKEKEELQSKYELIRIENEALKNDKFYLSKESLSLTEKLQTANDKVRNLEEDIRDMRKSNQSYIDKLTEKNLSIDNSYEHKLRQELDLMKKKYEADKESLKKLFEELADKRCAYLTEERDDYKSKVLKFEKVVKDKEENNDFLTCEIRTITKRTDEELAFLRVQLKIKVEELDRVSNLYEENVNIIKILKNENESLKDKNDIIRTELIRKEADFRAQSSELKAQISLLREKLANYEQIENELDKVIIDSAALNEDDKTSNEVINIIKDIPTTSKRRISQCLVLANKLKIFTIEIEKLKDLNKKLEEELRNTSEEKDLYKNVADRSKQPYSYLIKNIQDNELELHRKNIILEEKEQSIRSLLRENELLNEKVKAIESDMKIILNNRQKLDSLEEIIAKFIQNDADNEKDKLSTQNYFASNVNKSTKINTNNNLTSGNNIFTPMAMSHKSQNMSTSVVIPERDYNKTQVNETSSSQMPKWYVNLKMKEKMK